MASAKQKYNTQILKLNETQEMLRTRKIKIYALFQFFTFSTILFFGIALGLVVYLGVKGDSKLDTQFFEAQLKGVLKWESKDSLHIFTSILTYWAMMFWAFSMGIALLNTSNPTKNLFDTAFLLFFMIPLLSNVIALFSQISETVYQQTNTHVDKYVTKLDYLKELEELVKNEKKKQGIK